jgi:hypothetical protein
MGGTSVALNGKMFELLSEVYARSEKECNIDITFNQSGSGIQQNPCRDLVLTYLGGPTLVRGRSIAERLEAVTTHRSGLGLLFLIVGSEGRDHKFVISRFPAHSAISAEEDQQTLNVEFLERVFMRSAHAYKAVLYRDSSLTAGLWLGRVVDRQINDPEAQVSNYWIAEFLASDFRTTSAAGTRRLAVALREAAKKSSDVGVKSEIAAAVTLAPGLNGQRLSITEFGQQLRLSSAAMKAISEEVRGAGTVDERFQFDLDEFTRQIVYRTVELDSGGLLTADAVAFDRIFHREAVHGPEHKERFSTEGRVIGERLGKSR